MKPALMLFLVVLSVLCPACRAQVNEIRYDPVWDSALLGLSASCAVLGHFAFDETHTDFTMRDVSELSPIDAATRFPYDEGLSRLSIGAECLTLLWPSLFALGCGEAQMLPAAAAYVEALSLTFAAKDLVKHLISKARPYAYKPVAPDSKLLDEIDESFPSGHAALAFCAATSFAVLAFDLAPARSSTPWLVVGGYSLAFGTSVLRVVSGNHFLSDVAAGAILGSGIGWLVMKAHIVTASRRDPASARDRPLVLSVGPRAILVKLCL